MFVDHTARLGGGEIALLNLVSQLDPQKVQPTVVLLEDGPLRRRLEALGCPVHIVPLDPEVGDARKDSLGPASLLRAGALKALSNCARQLVAMMRQLEPTLVHTNSLKSDIIAGLAARWAGVPVLWHVRDRISPDYLPPRVANVFRLLCRLIPDRIIANSFATRHTLGSAAWRTDVVYDGTIVPPLAQADESQSNAPIVGLIGRLTPWKGQHIFLQAAAIVLQQFPTARFRLIGAALFGEEAYEQQLHAQAEQLGIAASVEFTGFRDDVQQQIMQLDLLVHASITPEPFGQVIIEGMAAAKPVIATAGGGALEIVVDRETGLLVPMNNPDAMAAAIISLLSNPAPRQTMGTHGRARVQQHFTIAQVARNVEHIYEAMLA